MLRLAPTPWSKNIPSILGLVVRPRCKRHDDIRSRKALWTTATSNSSSLEDAVQSCLSALDSRRTSTRNSLTKRLTTPLTTDSAEADVSPALCVVLATTHYPKHHLESLGEVVLRVLKPRALIGAVVDLVGPEGEADGPGLTISILDDATQVVAFRTGEDAVRHVKQKSVGRWPDLMRDRGSDVDGEKRDAGAFDWKRFTTVSMGGGNVSLPEELETMRNSEGGLHPLLLTLSDREPHQFLETLDKTFPRGTKVGLIGAMTPFATGRPHTLFYIDKVYSGGVVGAALFSRSLRPTATMLYSDLEPIGEPVVITNSRGNIILDIDGTNAAKELLARMSDRVMTQNVAAERQLYVKVMSGEESATYRLTGGDPTKGTLAVDTVKDLEAGMHIQFLQHMGSGAGRIAPVGRDAAIHFVCTNSDRIPLPGDRSLGSAQSPTATLSSTISAGTDGGFVLGKGAQENSAAGARPMNAVQGSLLCDVPGAELVLSIG